MSFLSASKSAELGEQDTPFTSATQAFNEGVSNGVYFFQFNSAETTQPFEMAYASYDGKGWVEIMYSSRTSGSTNDTFMAKTGAGPKNNSDFSPRFGLRNTGKTNFSIAGYQQDTGVNLLGSDFAATDIAFTSKSSKSLIDVNPTGQNQDNHLPLRKANWTGASDEPQVQQALLDFFRGIREGFSSGTSAEDFSAGVTAAGKGRFNTLLNVRNGSVDRDEWYIADRDANDTTTYTANYGYRQRYNDAVVGRWIDQKNTDRDSSYNIDSGNVLSVWLTDG